MFSYGPDNSIVIKKSEIMEFGKFINRIRVAVRAVHMEYIRHFSSETRGGLPDEDIVLFMLPDYCLTCIADRGPAETLLILRSDFFEDWQEFLMIATSNIWVEPSLQLHRRTLKTKFPI